MNEPKSFTIEGYLIIEAKKQYYGYTGRVDRFTKSKPSLTSKQIAMGIKIIVPNAFFERSMPVVNIELPETAVVNPDVGNVVKLSAFEIADKLQLDVTKVEDGLLQMIENKLKEQPK